MNVLSALRSVGIAVRLAESEPSTDGAPDALIEVTAGETKVRFAIQEKARAPYPNELARFGSSREHLCEVGQPVLVVPFVSEALAAQLTAAHWSWADAQGNFDLRAPGLLLRERRTLRPPEVKRRSLPQGSGALAIIRALIRFGKGEEEDASATGLAHQSTVSQPRVSQVLGQLHDLDLVTRSPRGRWLPKREALLDRFLAEYRGPGGTERYLYSLDSPTDVAVCAASLRSKGQLIAVSGDVGADLVVPWRRPTVVVLYTNADVSALDLGLVEAQGRHDANVLLRAPVDASVFRDHELLVTARDVDIRLADETQLIWDLQDLGGDDRLEAAEMMRGWLLTRP